MNKKALIVLIPLFSMFSLLVVPALALPTEYPSIQASGWAYIKTSEGCFSGCATLYVFFGAEDGAVPGLVTDGVPGDLVVLVVCDHAFEWIIDQSSIKYKCDVLTFRASPYLTIEVGTAVDPSTVTPITPLSSICVSIELCKPHLVTALGCTEFFIGTGQPLTPT